MVEHKDLGAALEDLAAEGDFLERVITDHHPDFELPTASPGWSVGHQIGHLIWTDRISALACRDRAAFARQAEAFGADPERGMDAGARREASGSGADVLAAWRSARNDLIDALRSVSPGAKIPWFGPSMTPAALASVRIMETWAHGVDITDVLGLPPSATARLWHIADLGVHTRDFAFSLHGLRSPSAPFRVELVAPSGESWCWGPATASDRITGQALDFCLLVAQRRHRVDLQLAATPGPAAGWLPIAQVFVGPAGAGRAARAGV
jgi:uncharacterized protein (TIGR03084 family)